MRGEEKGLNDHLSDPVKGGDDIAGFYYLFQDEAVITEMFRTFDR